MLLLGAPLSGMLAPPSGSRLVVVGMVASPKYLATHIGEVLERVSTPALPLFGERGFPMPVRFAREWPD